MAEQKESSVLFNLRELMNLEEDRIKVEDDKQKQADEDARRAREAEEQRLVAAGEAKRRGEEEMRVAAERAAREEDERGRRLKEEGELRVRLGVHLAHRKVAGEVVQNRVHGPARPAPRGPEVHQHRTRRVQHLSFEVVLFEQHHLSPMRFR